MPRERWATWPNVLSLLRLLGVPVFLWLVLGVHADVLAFLLLAAAGATDWLDGYLARRLNQVTALGALLDPLVDRLYIAATLLGLALRGIIPWWLVAVLAGRELLLAALLPVLRRHGRLALPVTFIGKTGTFALMWGLPLLLLGALPQWWGTTATVLGWAFTLWGTYLYWWAGLRYVGLTRALSGAAPDPVTPLG